MAASGDSPRGDDPAMNPLAEMIAQVDAAVAAALDDPRSGDAALAQVCEACMELLPVDGVSVSVGSGTEHREMLYASDATIAAVEELQFTLGEGPCFEAFFEHRPVLVADLGADSALTWPMFAAEVHSYPLGAVFAFALQSGAATFGTMQFYRRTAGWLTTDELATALQLVDLATTALLAGPAHAGPEGGGAMLPQPGEVIHQAAGMLIAEYRIPPADALARLRGYAFAAEVSVELLAIELTSRRIFPAEIGD